MVSARVQGTLLKAAKQERSLPIGVAGQCCWVVVGFYFVSDYFEASADIFFGRATNGADFFERAWNWLIITGFKTRHMYIDTLIYIDTWEFYIKKKEIAYQYTCKLQ